MAYHRQMTETYYTGEEPNPFLPDAVDEYTYEPISPPPPPPSPDPEVLIHKLYWPLQQVEKGNIGWLKERLQTQLDKMNHDDTAAAADRKPTLLLMGMKRSGKSSIAQVVFHKVEAHTTLFLESTQNTKRETVNSYIDFNIWDTPGHNEYYEEIFRRDDMFRNVGAIVWVIDGQDQYYDAFERLIRTCLHILPKFPHINIEVLIHKMDSFDEDFANDILTDITTKVQDELNDYGYTNPPISFYKTSIYDHTIFEALSRIIQKLLPQLPALESLLDSLVSTSPVEKVYLIDVLSKIYLAADSSPGDIVIYQNLSDWIDMIVDISELYGWRHGGGVRPVSEAHIPPEQSDNLSEAMMTFEKDGQKAMYFKEMNKFLALIMVMDQPAFDEQKALVDYNVEKVREGLAGLFST